MTMSSADTIDLCSSPLRPSAKKHRPAPSAVSSSSSSSRADQAWTCADCTFCNKDCTRNCEVCSADAPSGRERKAKAAAKEKMAVVDDDSEVEEQEDDGDDAWEMGQQQQVDKENKTPDAAPPASVPIKQEVKKEATTGGTKAASIAAAVPSSLSSSRAIAVVDVDGGGGSGGGAPIEAEWLPHGVVIIRQMVDAAEQELLLEDTVTNCMEGGKQHGHLPDHWFHNFRGNSGLDTGAAAKQQPACIELAANVFTHFRAQHGDAIARRDAAQVDPRLHFPVEFSSDSLFARAYRPASRCAPLYSPLTTGAFALFYLTATHLSLLLYLLPTGRPTAARRAAARCTRTRGGTTTWAARRAAGWCCSRSAQTWSTRCRCGAPLLIILRATYNK